MKMLEQGKIHFCLIFRHISCTITQTKLQRSSSHSILKRRQFLLGDETDILKQEAYIYLKDSFSESVFHIFTYLYKQSDLNFDRLL